MNNGYGIYGIDTISCNVTLNRCSLYSAIQMAILNEPPFTDCCKGDVWQTFEMSQSMRAFPSARCPMCLTAAPIKCARKRWRAFSKACKRSTISPTGSPSNSKRGRQK
ncbi:hypothetical protein CKO_03727 [Citrobacter koseri ATCC BAA-895]|uniref:Uncharacterized protein n=1 Tax=Citrobacter koseri (strain ATCC BAA-895 / CDC 4225-83 / SGSC4696) TaxID=290338 RepID=A8AMU0_CITK8|nr:hypothetical protein CKO_03727 [Citrobacter koseri ATCC BAA-895]